MSIGAITLYSFEGYNLRAYPNDYGSEIRLYVADDAGRVDYHWCANVPIADRWWRRHDRLERAVQEGVRHIHQVVSADRTAQARIRDATSLLRGVAEVNRIVADIGREIGESVA